MRDTIHIRTHALHVTYCIVAVSMGVWKGPVYLIENRWHALVPCSYTVFNVTRVPLHPTTDRAGMEIYSVI